MSVNQTSPCRVDGRGSAAVTPAPVIPAAQVAPTTRSSRARIPLDPPTGLIGKALNLYGAAVSRDTTSKITDRVVEEMTEWFNRPLDRVYPVIFIDAIVVKVRDGQVRNKPMYVVIGGGNLIREAPERVGSSRDKAGTCRHCQMVRVRRANQRVHARNQRLTLR